MSSDADKVVFDEAVAPQDNTVLFQSKKITYITDNSSNGGVFTGQLQFNLNTLANLNQWTDLSQALIQFPVRFRITNAGAASTPSTNNMMSMCVKNGFHQFVDSVQITVGGTTIQNAQIYSNVDTTFKILSEWSLEEYRKWGPSLGISIDDYQLAVDGTPSTYSGLDNRPFTESIAKGGFNIPFNANNGFKERAYHINKNVASTTTNSSILVNPSTLGKGNFKVASGEIAADADAFTLMTLATIRLKDISDVCGKLPPMKQLKGFIYINYNAGSYTFTTGATGGTVSNGSVVAATANYGHTHPAMIGSFAGKADAASTWKITGEVSGVGLNDCSVPHTNARLHVPYYVANPDVDRALSMKKTVRYLERFVTSFNIDAQQSYTGTLSPGLVNPKRVLLVPSLIGSGLSSSTGLDQLAPAPELSVLTHEPAGTGPFAALTGLQFIVGGVPMFQTPTTLDWEQFQTEIAQQGIDGGLVSQQTSGLLNQRLWDQLYRYYTCDVSRRMTSDDGSSKSIIVQCTNATKAKMRVLAFIWYEREIEVDTAMGTITQGL